MTRGDKREVDAFISDLQAQYFRYNKTELTQLMVRPMQLWEFAFPEGAFKTVLKTITMPTKAFDPKLYNYPQLRALRIMLRAKKIPAMDLSKTLYRITARGAVATYPIGTKKDKSWGPDPKIDNPEVKEGDEAL